MRYIALEEAFFIPELAERQPMSDPRSLAPLLGFIEALIVPSFAKLGLLNAKLKAYFEGVQKDAHIARGLGEMKAALEARMKQQAAS